MRMRWESIDSTTVFGGACLFFSFVVQRSFDQQSELYSEILCWTLLPLLLRVRERLFKTSRYQDLSGDSDLKPTFLNNLWLWTIAASLAVSCLYRSELGIVELQPILAPILLVVQTWIQSESATSATRRLSGTALCAVVGILSLSSGDIGSSALSLFAVLPQLLVYIALLPKEVLGLCRLPVIRDEGMDISRLCWRIVATLAMVAGIFLGIFGLIIPSMTHTFATGVAKAMLWFSLLQLRQHAPWYIAPAIETFGLVATRDPYVQSSEVHAVFDVVASVVTLAQVVYTLPKEAKVRHGLWIFLLASILPYVLNSLAIKGSMTSILHDHPVENLVNNAKAEFEQLLQRQSRDFTAAQNEYQRRYNMEPPPGFEDWFNFAKAHNSPIIDDFNTIHDSVSPFWRLSGNEVFRMMRRARSSTPTELWQCIVGSKSSKTTCAHHEHQFDRHISLLFNQLLGDESIKLPGVKVLVNGLDEPSIMIPPESLGTGVIGADGHFNLTVMSRRPIWEELTRHCSSERRDASSPEKPGTFGMPFVTDKSSSMNLCQHPEYRTTHGLLQRPSSFSLIEEPLPVLSPGVPSTMADILYPSAAYIEEEFQYDETHDPDWDHKRNNLYWAGSNTGGFSSDGQWRYFHRQRFVALAQNLEQKSHIYLQKIGDSVQRVGSSFLNARLYDVAFTRIFQCERSACRGQRTYFRRKPWADRYKALRSRLAFDLDGNGISGRYYQLLASKSVPLKQTLLREWHDDRLVPWAHYIPVSQSMDELPELVNYLTSSEIGQQKAKEIAELGRDWHAKAFREVDMTIYVYRLLLEVARLQDVQREATVPATS